jgi:hypothetical protein
MRKNRYVLRFWSLCPRSEPAIRIRIVSIREWVRIPSTEMTIRKFIPTWGRKAEKLGGIEQRAQIEVLPALPSTLRNPLGASKPRVKRHQSSWPAGAEPRDGRGTARHRKAASQG